MPRQTEWPDFESLNARSATLRSKTGSRSRVYEQEPNLVGTKILRDVLDETRTRTDPADEPPLPYPRLCPASTISSDRKAGTTKDKTDQSRSLKSGHGLTYAGVSLFTLVLYVRPAEFFPSPLTASIALVVGLLTLAVFVPSQLALEGTLTARPREVNLILLLCLIGLISVPLAVNPTEAWVEFSGTFIRCIVIFIVMINAVRTEFRLKGLLFLSVLASCALSLGALNDFRLGLLTVEGYRVAGVGQGIFGNSNDMAFHLATTIPVAIALGFSKKSVLRRLLFSFSAVLMMAGIVVTYSRGAFLGCVVGLGFLLWKLAGNNKFTVLGLVVIAMALLIAIGPGNYSLRILSIFVPSLDPVGSSSARQGELFRSLYVALRHPLIGVGMGNYSKEMSYSGLVTHNSYTQVASEMGLAALIIYTMFVVSPLRKLRQIELAIRTRRLVHPHYYLVIGLQASLLTYLVSSFFASVAYLWYIYYLVAYAVCLRRLYNSNTQEFVTHKRSLNPDQRSFYIDSIVSQESGTAAT